MPAAPDGQLLGPTEASAVALRTAAIPAVVVGVVAVVVGYLINHGLGALGALLGAVVAILFFGVGQYVLGRILAGNPEFALSAGLLLYLTQVLVLFGLIVLLRDASWLDGRIFGITIIAVTFAWIGGSLLATQRVKMLYVDPSHSPEAATSEATPAEYDQ